MDVGVRERQSEDSFVCFGAKPTQRACARYLLPDRKKTRKGEVPGQSTEEGSQRQSGKGDSQRKAAAEQGAGTCGPRGWVGGRERMSQHSRWLCGNFVRVHARDSTEAGDASKVPKTSPFLR